MTTGVLVMAYGTPEGPGQVEQYYTHIRRGRPPEPEQLADLRRRYDAIGGISPLRERTLAQLRTIEASLGEIDERGTHLVTLGQKHAEPFVEDGVAELRAAGVEQIVGLVLAPHFSASSVGGYHARAAAVAGDTPYVGIESWHLEPELLDFQAAALRSALGRVPERSHVVFTAHSLPERALVDDPYPDQLRETAEATAQRVGLAPWAGWGIGWQSAGRSSDPWRGPDVLEIIRTWEFRRNRYSSS